MSETLPKYRPWSCPDHQKRSSVSMPTWQELSDAYEAKGVQQKVCAKCGCYTWPVERCAEFVEHTANPSQETGGE